MIHWGAVAIMIGGIIAAFVLYILLPALALDDAMHGRKKSD
jgi:hypothetical protein